MKIHRVEASYLTNIPITPPPLLKEPSRATVIIVEVETDNGIVGYGATMGTLPWLTVEFINRQAAPFLKDQDPMLTERIWNQMFQNFNPRAPNAVWSWAMSAIDIALWDVKGKALGQSVWRLLGGAQNPVPAYITFGLPDYSLEQLVEAAKYWVGQGQDKLKMVVGVVGNSQDPDEDATRVRAVRETVGPGVQLMMDANCRMSFHHALRLCKLCEPYNITWFEEPVYQNDARLLANLRRQTTIPIATGQSEVNRFRFLEFLVHEAVDILQPNVINVGGYTEALKVAAMAQAFNKPIANGGAWPFQNMHLQAGMSNGWRVEFHYIRWMTCKSVYKETPDPVKGWVTVPETLGLGLDPKLGIINEYRASNQ
ncbi:mandelate racemase/muconate lactonizing enzyme family protein [Chloroflexota bacterium]